MGRIFLEVARAERNNIVALLFGFTKIGQHSGFIGFICLEAAEKGNENIVKHFFGNSPTSDERTHQCSSLQSCLQCLKVRSCVSKKRKL